MMKKSGYSRYTTGILIPKHIEDKEKLEVLGVVAEYVRKELESYYTEVGEVGHAWKIMVDISEIINGKEAHEQLIISLKEKEKLKDKIYINL